MSHRRAVQYLFGWAGKEGSLETARVVLYQQIETSFIEPRYIRISPM